MGSLFSATPATDGKGLAVERISVKTKVIGVRWKYYAANLCAAKTRPNASEFAASSAHLKNWSTTPILAK